MIFINVDDFFSKAEKTQRLTREEEKSLALKMINGDKHARQMIFEGYLGFTASFVKRAPKYIQTLDTVYRAVATLEKSLDSFDFSKENASFVNYLSVRLRKCMVECIADR